MSAGPGVPSGTVTFLFTDIEGSTQLLKRLREGYAAVLAEHEEILRAAFAAHGGYVVDTQGDSFFVAFRRAKDAVSAAVAGQQALSRHEWPYGVELRVRMGIHTGQAEATDGRYHGLAVHRASRIGDSAHGGQVLVSQTTRDLLDDEEEEAAGVELRDLGELRLKDLDRPVHLYQLLVDGLPAHFPPLRVAPSAADQEHAPAGRRRWGLLAPAALVAIAGAVTAAVLLTRGSSSTQQASAVSGDSVGVFDAKSGKLIGQTALETAPGAIAAGEGSLWVANVNDDSVSRIDPDTNASVQTISVENGPEGVAVGGGFVWVVNSLSGTVSKIDPRKDNGTVVHTIRVGNHPTGVAFGGDAVWVANSADRTVQSIDPRTDKPAQPIVVDAGADAVVLGAGSLWVTSESAGVISRVDPRSRNVVARVGIGQGPSALAFGAGAAWVANSDDGTVTRVDSATNRPTGLVRVGAGPSGLVVTRDGAFVWVSNELGGTLSLIDAARNGIVKTVETGNRPEGVAVSADRLYVSVRNSGLAHRGGTLTVAERGKIGPEAAAIDPSLGYGSWELLILTNDGLVTFKRAGGSEGSRLVADLATSLPTPTDGGHTYTFQLRPGVRYSNGAPVRPADFRRGLERTLVNAGLTCCFPRSYYSSIVGADRCLKAKRKRCDLSRGIIADAETNTITFRLTAADPDFLYKLALPTADAVPASTPFKARLPLPATGPYTIRSYDAKHGVIRLVRNTRFREWSAAAQPDGYPDAIMEKWGYSTAGGLRAVGRGSADLTALLLADPTRLLESGYASQLHPTPQLSTIWFSLNTRLPPFNDVRVRQAVNYAVDRNRLTALVVGSVFVHPTCQILPPNLLGYRRYCPYTIDERADGTYTGPDLAKAKRLVAASGTKGQPVTVWAVKSDVVRGTYLVKVLRSLGYDARLKRVKSFDTFLALTADSRRKVQASSGGWSADYPAASNFFAPLFTCASFKPGTTTNNNASEFCNRRIDGEIARAQALQTSDPHAAAHLWSRIDHEIVDEAPVVATYTPRHLDFVSRRVGNYQYSPLAFGALLDQLWVK